MWQLVCIREKDNFSSAHWCLYWRVVPLSISTQGEENLDNDFWLKEAPDGSVLFESVPNKGRYIQITTKDKTGVNIMRNFSIILLVRQHMYIKVV